MMPLWPKPAGLAQKYLHALHFQSFDVFVASKKITLFNCVSNIIKTNHIVHFFRYIHLYIYILTGFKNAQGSGIQHSFRFAWPILSTGNKNLYLILPVQRFYGVMVSTFDSESCDPSSSLGRTLHFIWLL